MYTVIVPVLNEEGNLKKLLPPLLQEHCEVIVCDNGSTDNSVEVAKGLGVRVSVGTGSVTDAILRGMGLASHGKVIVIDGDLSHPPGLVPELAEALDENDMVVGSRYIEGGESRDTLRNRIISLGFNLLSFPLEPRIKDRASGFWGIRKGLVETPIGNTVKPMLEYLVRANPITVCEIPYIFQPRRLGEAKIGKPVLETLKGLLRLYLQKYNRFIKYCVVGGIGTLIVFGVTYSLTEFTGLWYMFSLGFAAIFAAIWNFTGHKYITYAKGGAYLEPDYEWNAWFRGNPLQRYWKRRIGYLTKTLLGEPSMLLDVGCGSSPTINLFHCERVGMDRSKEKLDFIRKYSSAVFVQWDLENGLKTNSEFDAVVCNNVLEHLKDPERVVEGISRVLVVGGKVVVTVPNAGRLLTRVMEWIYGKMMPGGYAKEHMIKFTPEILDSMCGKFGLKLLTRKSVLTDMVCCYAKEVI